MTTNIYEFLGSHNIPYTKHEHEAVFTVEEANKLYGYIPGAHTKNLFLHNKDKSQYYLVIIASYKRADLKKLGEELGEKKLHFAKPNELKDYLQLTPGSVSALGLIHDGTNSVKVVIDTEVWNSEQVNAHPNINTATLTFARDDFRRLFIETGHTPKILNL